MNDSSDGSGDTKEMTLWTVQRDIMKCAAALVQRMMGADRTGARHGVSCRTMCSVFCRWSISVFFLDLHVFVYMLGTKSYFELETMGDNWYEYYWDYACVAIIVMLLE